MPNNQFFRSSFLKNETHGQIIDGVRLNYLKPIYLINRLMANPACTVIGLLSSDERTNRLPCPVI